MDIIQPKSKRKVSTTVVVAAGILIAVLFCVYQFMQPASSQKVKQSEVLTGIVKRGDMNVEVKGYGVLRSDKQKLLTSMSSATIEEIVLKPGALVKPDSVILQMSNPELVLDLELSRQKENQEKANLRQLKLNNIRDLMSEEAAIAQLTASYKSVKMQRIAEEQLVDKGVVSRLAFNATKTDEEQLFERIEIQGKRRAQLLLVHDEAINIQKEQINQAHSNYQTIMNRVDSLTVKAGIEGVLQRLSVELGQSVTAGQALALVGSTNDLVALIQVPQTQAEKVQVGQSAYIDTRADKVKAVVTRISPAVAEGTVTVELAFSDLPPSSARPELNVNGTIFTQTLSSVWYIERPLNVGENSKNFLFKLSPQKTEAIASEVTFGTEAGRYIQIVKGANEGEIFILSDMDSFDPQNKLTIIQ